MARVVLFGTRDFAGLAHYYLKRDSEHEVVAFSVHSAYMPREASFQGLPIVPFEDVGLLYPPSDCAFFAPMSPRNMNRDRKAVYDAIKQKGYRCISYVSSKATVFDNEIGENCFILEGNNIQPRTRIGNNVVLFGGNFIGHHGVIHDHVTVTLRVVMGGHCDVESYSVFGLNSTVRDGLHIAEGSFVAMAAAIVSNTEAWGVYKGNPASKSSRSSVQMKL